MIITSLNEAVNHFIKVKTEQDNDRVVSNHQTLQGVKGPIMKIFDCRKEGEKDTRRYYVSFKRDFLHSFKHLFKLPNEGFGQTFNMRVVIQAANDGFNSSLVTVMPNNSIYYCKSIEAYGYIAKNNTIRIPSTEVGKEGSIPARMLEAIDLYHQKNNMDMWL
jgi:hypothetical protein